MEPGHCGACRSSFSTFPSFLRQRRPAASRTTSSPTVDGPGDPRRREFRRVYQQQMHAYRAVLRRQRRRAAAEAARHRPAHRPADDRGSRPRWSKRSAWASRRATPRCANGSSSLPAFQENGQFIGDAALRAAAADAEPADARPTSSKNEVRRGIVAEKLAGGAHRLDHGQRCGGRGGVQAAQREGEAGGGLASRPTSSATASRATDAEIANYFDAHKDDFRVPEKRKIRFVTIDQEAIRASRRPSPASRSSAYYDDNHAAVLDARAGARRAHPAQDRRQGRRGGQEAGGGDPRQGRRRAPISRSSRRSTPKTTRARPRGAISATSAGARW